jgi:ligand-binding SRPBCC domain-containing protein
MLPEYDAGGIACRHHPSSQTGDYTDVLVQSPYGEIPWPRLSRLNGEEMKALMIDVVNKTYHALTLLFHSQAGRKLIEMLAQRELPASVERANLELSLI